MTGIQYKDHRHRLRGSTRRKNESCGQSGHPPPPSGEPARPDGAALAPGQERGGAGAELAGPVLVDPRHGHALAPGHGGRRRGLGRASLRGGADELAQVVVDVDGASRGGGAEAVLRRAGERGVAEGGVAGEVAGAPRDAAHVQVPRRAQRADRRAPQPAQVELAAAASAHG